MSQLGALTNKFVAGSPLHHDDDDDDPRQACGRLMLKTNSLPSSPVVLSRISRSSRPTISSPLSTPNNVPSPSSAKSTFELDAIAGPRRDFPIDSRSRGNTTPTSTGGITFYTDSSNPSSPVEESPRTKPSPTAPNDTRTPLFQPLTVRPAEGSSRVATLAMATSVVTAPQAGSAATALARKSSIDSAVSAVASSMQLQGNSNSDQRSEEIARLIKTAGSAEIAIQHLLKERQSQSQQNSQLWRLVDKQRAMILGLNKDLEAALKDKEKYRRQLKEMAMASPSPIKATKGQGSETQVDHGRSDAALLLPHLEPPSSEEPSLALPDSPTLDAESRLASPIDMVLAPYLMTPPTERIRAPSAALTGFVRPAAEERESIGSHRAAGSLSGGNDAMKDERLGLASTVGSSPTSFSLRSSDIPPKMLPPMPPPKAPPKVPNAHSPPIVKVVEPTPQPNEGLAKFPSPPRKGPPAPLQLNKQEIRRHLRSASISEDTDSDYDDPVPQAEVEAPAHENRGRRRTREEDDRERDIVTMRETEARSASKKSRSSMSRSANMVPSPDPPAMPIIITQEVTTQASLNAVLNGSSTGELALPFVSPGLPASPRPFGNAKMMLGSAPLSPRNPPLSPRPPRQPIPLPPHTPLAPPPNSVTPGDAMSPGRPANVARRMAEASQHSGHTKSQSGPAGRTQIYKGLVTEEYPDLLLPPNALPSIAVKVASSRMRLPRASLMALTQLEEDPVFTLAVISRADNGELWRVEKDSLSLVRLDQRLKMCATFTARTPDRSLFNGHAPAKLDARRWALDQYMDEVLNTPLDTSTAVELCRYLSTNALPPNTDEIRPIQHANGDSADKKPDNRPIRSGYLTKKGKNFGGWKARFFVLDGPLFKYYESPGGTHLGTIKLENAQIGKQSQGGENQSQAQNQNQNQNAHHGNDGDLDNQYRHAFLILEQKKKDSGHFNKHVLCAESDVERDVWVESLLKWIEQDAGEEQPGQSSASGGKIKKAPPPMKAHQATQSGSDMLIGVRYDTTHAGEAPQGAPGTRPRTAGVVEAQMMGGDSVQQKTISGPRDPQIISDSAAWGNRAAPTPLNATHDEKKQRKRSFFGFGARARNSSDGQESMFGGSESGVSPTPPQNAFHGPVRQVFGAPLAEAVRYNRPVGVNVPLPSVVYRCIQYLESRNAVFEEGIFRLSGSNVVIKQLRERFNTEGDVNLMTDEHYYDIHAVASLLKLYLRELPTSILTRELHLEFLTTTEMADREEKLAALGALVLRLPQANGTLLKYLIAFLIRIINNADVNKMTVRNVGIVFSPTLHIPAPIFAIFLQNYEAIFGIDPEEYELPSPVGEAEAGVGRSESALRFEMAGRPSTSSGSASPHRQGWIESIRDQSRSTPTPPLLMNLNTARGSPTPFGSPYVHHSPRAGASQTGYEAASQEGKSRGPHWASTPDLPSQPSSGDERGATPTMDQQQQNHHHQQQQQQRVKSRWREEAYF